MYSRSGCGRTDSDSTRGASGWLGHGLHFELDLLADRDPALLQHRLQRARRSACVGLGHVDVGQHLLDRVALLEAQGELVAVGRRRLVGRPAGLLARPSRRLAGLEALEIIGCEALEVGVGDGRRQRAPDRAGPPAFRPPGAAGCRRRTAPWSRTRAAQGQADGTGGESDRPEQHEQRRLWRFRAGPTEGGNPS